MGTIEYKIKFFTYWHCGSGLAKGADIDTLVVKDKDRLPYVPGKTLKGLLREAVETLIACKNEDKTNSINNAFGKFDGKENCNVGRMFFNNAELPETDRNAIVANNYQQHLYSSVAATKIDEDGIAQNGSLRKMEVVVPCELIGKILDVPSELEKDIIEAFGMIKRLGVNRNRGLGRCEITLLNNKGKEADK